MELNFQDEQEKQPYNNNAGKLESYFVLKRE